MENEAYCVIKPLIVTEGVMPTLVCYDPNTSQDTALEGPVYWPDHIRQRLREEVEVIGGNVKEDKGKGHVLNHKRK